MAKLYIFGIGGTGSRVIKSLTMLLASGCKLPNNFDTIIPIIIDPDTSNGDLNRTKDILKLYQQIRNQVHHPDDFFGQEVKTVNDLANNTSDINSDHFQFTLSNVDQQTFGDYIGFNTLKDDHKNSNDDKNFTRLLYSEKNLNSNLNVGFKGNPNMGAIVLNQFTDSEDFKRFGQTFNNGDAVFIINSIFGGTGAAGFPLLLKNLRGNDNIPNSVIIKGSKIGGITYLPYFALSKNDENDEINSDSFMDKAKTAMDYYNRTIINQNQIDSLYFIGNSGNNKHLDYAVGGIEQKNNAHFLELAGALAIFDFCSKINTSNNNIQIKEFGIENDTKKITFRDLNLNNYKQIARPLTKFKLFTEYLNIGLPKALNISRWTKSDIKFIVKKETENSFLNEDYFNKPEYTTQVVAFNNHFNAWLDEMDNNQPSFSPFNNIKWGDALDLIDGIPSPKRSKSFKVIDIENCKLITEKSFRPTKYTMHTTLIKMFAKSIDNVLDKHNLLKQ